MKRSLALVLTALITATTSCSTITAESETSVKAEAGVPGGEMTRTTTIRATVTAIDSAKREVRLVTRHGENFKVTAGPEVVNFNQIRIGDQLEVVSSERLEVRMAKPGEKLDDESSATADLARIGAMPGARVTETSQYVATVSAIDTKRRKVTLTFSDGSTDKFDVRPDIDLSAHQVGEKVLIRTTESLAMSMTRP